MSLKTIVFLQETLFKKNPKKFGKIFKGENFFQIVFEFFFQKAYPDKNVECKKLFQRFFHNNILH